MKGCRTLGRSYLRLSGVLCFLCLLCIFAAGQPPTEVIRFAVIGDSGSGDEFQYRIAQQMLAWHARYPFELVLMLGDNVYGGMFGWGGGNEQDFEEKFDIPYAGLLGRGVTFRAALGNHDMREDEGQDLIRARDRFHIDGGEGYYSFTAGSWESETGERAPLVEFFVLNTVRVEHDKQDPEQLGWLESALAVSRARWRIVYGHHPMYSTGREHGSDLALRAKIEPLLLGAQGAANGTSEEAEPRVAVVFAGHDHIYERFRPQKGITYFVCGSSGKLRRGDARPSSAVAAIEDRQRVFMLWEATPDELRFRAINEKGEAFDCGRLRPGGRVEELACAPLAVPGRGQRGGRLDNRRNLE